MIAFVPTTHYETQASSLKHTRDHRSSSRTAFAFLPARA
jgi:hypothetical protein